jgi:hypothetical protein
MDSYEKEPSSVTLDIDDTCDVAHGHQQLSLFNAHVWMPPVMQEFFGQGRNMRSGAVMCPTS